MFEREYETQNARIAAANAERAAVAEQDKSIKAMLGMYDDEINRLADQIATLHRKQKEAREKKAEFAERRWDLNKRQRTADNEERSALSAIDLLKKQEALEAERIRQAALQAQQNTVIDEATADKEWREFAYHHQLDGAHFMAAAKRVVCGDGMGLGKTLQSLMTVDMLEAIGESHGRVLIVAPGEICLNFELEGFRWFPDRCIVNIANLGTKETIEQIDFWEETMQTAGDDSNNEVIFIINYDILARSNDVLARIITWGPDTVIGDEAHKLKNTSSKNYGAMEQLILGYNKCSICLSPVWPADPKKPLSKRVFCLEGGHDEIDGIRSVENVVLMTGTPLRNRPTDFYALLHLVHPEIFEHLHDFQNMYCSGFGTEMTWSYNGYSRLVNKIKGFYIARDRNDAGIKLPPQTIRVHEIEPGKGFYERQQKLLRDLKERYSMEIDEGKVQSVFDILPLITRLRQASVWPGGIYVTSVDPVTGLEYREHVGAKYLESAKLDKAVELIKEFIDNDQRIAVFSSFLEPLQELERRLGDTAVLFAGPTPKDQRSLIKQNFDRNSGEAAKWSTILAHYGLGGEGLNLTACTQTIILDEFWNGATQDQAYARTDRGGQTEETQVHILRLVCKGSFDKPMAELIEKKAAMVGQFNTEFKFQELAEMFKNS